jgi:hypothetical protein
MKRAFLFGVVVLVAACSQASPPASKWSANGTVDGFYRVDGKDVKLGFAHSQKGEPFAGHPTIVVALSEKDSAEAKDDPLFWHAKFGGSLVVTLQKNSEGTYDVIGSNFTHPAAKDGGSNGTGMVDIKDVKDANGEIAGELLTKPGMTMSDQKLDIDLKFKVPMPALK